MCVKVQVFLGNTLTLSYGQLRRLEPGSGQMLLFMCCIITFNLTSSLIPSLLTRCISMTGTGFSILCVYWLLVGVGSFFFLIFTYFFWCRCQNMIIGFYVFSVWATGNCRSERKRVMFVFNTKSVHQRALATFYCALLTSFLVWATPVTASASHCVYGKEQKTQRVDLFSSQWWLICIFNITTNTWSNVCLWLIHCGYSPDEVNVHLSWFRISGSITQTSWFLHTEFLR